MFLIRTPIYKINKKGTILIDIKSSWVSYSLAAQDMKITPQRTKGIGSNGSLLE